MNNQSQLFELNYYQYIKISGPDFRKFLQGQLSCNMDKLSLQHSLRGAICNLKGRVIADVRVVETADGCLLQVGQGMAEVVLATLSRYAVFSKVKLELQEPHPMTFGVLGALPDPARQHFEQIPEAPDAVTQAANSSLIRVAGEQPRWEIWTHNSTETQALRTALQGDLVVGNSAWRRADIQAGIIHVDASTTEEFTPQLLNYDISGVIDFKKGCYTGQEVVARMFYRGTAKKRLYLASTMTQLTANDSVHEEGSEEDKEATILAFSNPLPDSNEPALLLAVLSTEAVANGQVFTLADQPEAKLTVLPLEY